MTTDPPPALRRLLAEEPFVRLLARTLLADEADEVVQRTWLAAVQHGGDGVDRPRSWLARIARHVAANLRRDGRRRRAREDAAGATLPVPSSAELLLREERRRQLVAAVDALPAPLRAVVLLRWFEGLPPREIAARAGLPVATVWNRLRRALQLLRAQLDDEHGGDRRAWLLPLVPVAARTEALPLAEPAAPVGPATVGGAGVLAMTMQTKFAVALAAVLAATGLLALRVFAGPDPAAHAPAREAAAAPATGAVERPVPPPAAAAPERTAAAPSAPPARTGALVVHVRHGDDAAPAAGVTVIAGAPGGDARIDGRRGITAGDGTVRFDDLDPTTPLWVRTDRGDPPTVARIDAGATTQVDLTLPIGVHLEGVVVDAAGTPVAAALVEVAPLALSDCDAEVLAVTGADGRFAVRGAPTAMLVGARADGHSASRLVFVLAREGNDADVRLQLGPPAGSVHGVVVDAAGRPIAGAVVRVGTGSTSGIAARRDGAPPLPAQVRTDGAGTFTAVGVPPGRPPVTARAAGHATWSGIVDVAPHLTAQLRIVLEDGATLRGVVRQPDGAPARHVEVEVGEWGDLDHHRAITRTDGSFLLTGLRGGEVTFVARHDELGRTEHRVGVTAGAVTHCDVTLSQGRVVRGRIVDEAGAPVAGAALAWAAAAGPPRAHHVRASAAGRFVLVDCPPDTPLRVTVGGDGYEEQDHRVAATVDTLEITLRRSLPATARITGRVCADDGRPLANARVSALRTGRRTSTGIEATDADGRFDTGPLVPGTWTLRITAADHPAFVSEPHELAVDEVRDLGEVRLRIGGEARVTVAGDREGVRFRVADAALRGWTGLTDRDGELATGPLAPGTHRLFVSGPSTAAQVIPFSVGGGATTRVAVRLVPGVRQVVELAPATANARPDWVDVRALRGDALLAFTAVALEPGTATRGEFCLAPGDYTFVVLDGETELARVAHTVGESAGPPLRIPLP